MARGRVCKTINCCIYCGNSNDELTDEHVLAANLGGTWILSRASCKSCQKIINEQIEQPALQKMFKDIRYKKAIGSRRIAKRPKMGKIKIPRHDKMFCSPESEGFEWVQKDIEWAKLPVYLAFPIFHRPRIFERLGEIDNMDDHVYAIFAKIHNPPTNKIESPMSIKASVDIAVFSRLLAKTAHGVTVLKFGIDGFTPLLKELILGMNLRSVPMLIGCTQKPQSVPAPYQIMLGIGTFDDKKWIFLDIHLFADLGAPIYRVVSGTLP